MQAGRGQPNHRVAGPDSRTVDHPVSLDNADNRAHQIVITRRIHAAQLRRLCFLRFSANYPAIPPIAPGTSGRRVLRTLCLRPLLSVSANEMSTPAVL